MFKEKGVVLIFFIAPLLYPFLYSFVYKNEVVREIPMAVVDLSASSESRDYLRKINSAPEVEIATYCSSLNEATELFKNQTVRGILVIPSDFSENINTGKQSFVSGYFDMGSFIYYKNMMTVVSMVSKEYGMGISEHNLAAAGLSDKEIETIAAPLPYEGIPLFNSSNGFASFLLPAVFILILYQTLMLGIGMLGGINNEERIFEKDIKDNGIMVSVAGRALCYFSLYIIWAAYMLWFIPRIFNLPQIGNQFDLFLFIIPFLLSTTFLAMTISVTFRSMERPFLILLFMTLPLLFLAGVSWPQSNIPAFWKVVGYLFPSTHGIQGYVRINTMQANLTEVGFELSFLWVLSAFYFITACISYKIKSIQKIEI